MIRLVRLIDSCRCSWTKRKVFGRNRLILRVRHRECSDEMSRLLSDLKCRMRTRLLREDEGGRKVREDEEER